jgi:hypothetical protein
MTHHALCVTVEHPVLSLACTPAVHLRRSHHGQIPLRRSVITAV